MVHNTHLSKIFKILELKGYKYSSVLKPLFLYKSNQNSDPSTLIQRSQRLATPAPLDLMPGSDVCRQMPTHSCIHA